MNETSGIAQQPAEQASAPIRVLVVDDDPEIREILGRFLSGRGYQVDTATDGKEGLELIRQKPPDVVFLDMELPELSGLDVLRKMLVKNIDPLVIGISGHPLCEQCLGPDSIRLGAADFISKPFDLEHLESTLAARLQALNEERGASGVF